MKGKHLLILPALLGAFLFVSNIEAKAGTVTDSIFSDVPAAAYWFYPFHITIESILNNPAVAKKQVSRHSIQATGRRQTGHAHFIIHFRKEQLHGDWQSFYNANRRADSGRFHKGLPDGVWKTWYPGGQLKTVRNYSAAKYHYIRYDIQRNHPKEQRYAITRYDRKNQARHFRPQYEGSTAINQHASLLEKINSNTSKDGNIYLPPFLHCLHHGLYINYYENGAVKDSGNYVNGLKHGLWKEAVETGPTAAFGYYDHGVRQGQWKWHNNTGELFYTELYKPDGTRKEWHYFEK
jgi:antitoxin component YwqK of YwqJK toxin-antitoxin module